MATSGSKSVTVTQWDTLKFSWERTGYSLANNTSTIGWKLELISDSSGRIDSSTSKAWSVTVNGTKYSGTNSIAIANNTTKTLASGSTVITHGTNGAKTFAYSFSQAFNITFAGSSIGTISGSSQGTIDSLQRRSTFTISGNTLGSAQTFTITRNDSTFKHRIKYYFASNNGLISGYVAGSDSTFTTSTSVSWTPPLTLASNIKEAASFSITYTLYTYTSDGTTVGNSESTIVVNIPSSVKPSCTLTVTDATGYADTYGSFIKGLSKFKVVVTPTLAYSSPIASYNVTANGIKYTAASITTDVLKSSGTLTISATVTDKRGRSGSASTTKTVVDYKQPVIPLLTAKRCNEDGTLNDEGAFVLVTLTATVMALNNKNGATYTLQYKKSTEGEFSGTVNTNDIAGNYAPTGKTYIFPADTSSSYDVQLIAADDFKTETRNTTVSTAFTLMHWDVDKKSLAIGKEVEEDELFDVGLPSRFNKPVHGKVLGLDKLPQIPANSDLDNYIEPGCYAVYRNADAATIANMPKASAGRLEVTSATGEGIRDTEWSYVRQKFTPYHITDAVYERSVTRNASNVWSFSEWTKTTLSKAASVKVYHEQKVLWGDDMESGMYMTAGHTATLKEKVSEQANGIILVFCYYNGASDTNWGWITRFVPKLMIDLNPGSGYTFELTNGKFGSVGTKYLYINDDDIVGHADNNLTGTAGSGITFANNKFVLRYVLGV